MNYKNYYLGSLIFSASWYSLCVCVTFSLVLTILRQTLQWHADYHFSFASSTLPSCISQKIMISLKNNKIKRKAYKCLEAMQWSILDNKKKIIYEALLGLINMEWAWENSFLFRHNVITLNCNWKCTCYGSKLCSS